jgi:hypothetical protein
VCMCVCNALACRRSYKRQYFGFKAADFFDWV